MSEAFLSSLSVQKRQLVCWLVSLCTGTGTGTRLKRVWSFWSQQDPACVFVCSVVHLNAAGEKKKHAGRRASIKNMYEMQSVVGHHFLVADHRRHVGNKVALTRRRWPMGGRRTQPASSGPSPVILCLLFEALLDAVSASVGWKCGRGESEGICAYHKSLSSHRQESAARSSVGESTCIQNAEERTSKRNGARMVGGREGEKKLAPARHPVSGRFWSFSQEGSIVLDTSSSLYVPAHA